MSEIIKVEGLKGVQRADLYLISVKPNLTRTAAKKLIQGGIVTVNGQKVGSNYRLKNSETLEIGPIDSFLDNMENSQIKSTKMKLEIIFEDEDIVAVNKPAGVLPHPTSNNREDSLLNGVMYYLNSKGGITQKPRPLHRLDKDTSGVMLFSKNKESNDFYSKLFETHDIHKTYLAVVEGDFAQYMSNKTTKDYFEIFSYIGRSSRDSKIYTNTSKEKGLPARTRVYFQKYWKHPRSKKLYSLVRVEPETGRTHQIRVHLSEIGFPIVGDRFYNGQKFERLMLHALALTLKLKNGEQKELFTKIPKEFIL